MIVAAPVRTRPRRPSIPRRPYTPRLPAAARRDQLLDAALRIIARDGYAAVSIESIAREVGVTRPVVYNVFDGLDPLLHALLDRQAGRALAQVLGTISGAPDPADVGDWLRRTIADLVAMVAGDPLTWTPIFVASGDTPAAVRGRIEREREVVRLRIRDLVAITLPRDPRRDVDIAAHSLVALGEYFGRLILQSPDDVDAERIAGTLASIFAPG